MFHLCQTRRHFRFLTFPHPAQGLRKAAFRGGILALGPRCLFTSCLKNQANAQPYTTPAICKCCMAALLSQGIVQLQKSVIFNSPKGTTKRNARRNEDVRTDVKMPDTVQIRHSAFHVLGEDLSAWLYKAIRRLEDYRLYRQSVDEMSDLSARELADLGLHRSEIKRVAYETIYGQRP